MWIFRCEVYTLVPKDDHKTLEPCHGSVSSLAIDLIEALDTCSGTRRTNKLFIVWTLSSTSPTCTQLRTAPLNCGESRLRMRLLLWMAQPCTEERCCGPLPLWPSVWCQPILRMIQIPRDMIVAARVLQPNQPRLTNRRMQSVIPKGSRKSSYPTLRLVQCLAKD